MNISLLYGNSGIHDPELDNYVESLEKGLEQSHAVSSFMLHDMNIKSCMGCWDCWIKTPGQCIIKDDAQQVLKSVVRSDFTLFVSPLIAGFVSYHIKMITDRFVGMVLPYITFIQGECHHLKRYDSYPGLGVLLKEEPDTDNEDITIVQNIYKRLVINFHSELLLFNTIDNTTIEKVVHEISNI